MKAHTKPGEVGLMSPIMITKGIDSNWGLGFGLALWPPSEKLPWTLIILSVYK